MLMLCCVPLTVAAHAIFPRSPCRMMLVASVTSPTLRVSKGFSNIICLVFCPSLVWVFIIQCKMCKNCVLWTFCPLHCQILLGVSDWFDLRSPASSIRQREREREIDGSGPHPMFVSLCVRVYWWNIIQQDMETFKQHMIYTQTHKLWMGPRGGWRERVSGGGGRRIDGVNRVMSTKQVSRANLEAAPNEATDRPRPHSTGHRYDNIHLEFSTRALHAT